ncbi:cysteine-rich venom protein 1-like [Hylaeus anthracinus]|uniref:cysteine-rich venom protein 1-like n=1 Tax=Hylaeus anthracinus TaxID=313031 RepID=UPI0023B921EE|nr:cysteine-rich venom protein 1-like [Hylaeus anthracinus]
MSLYAIAFVLLIAVVHHAASLKDFCPANQTWSDCGPVCEPTCERPEKIYCSVVEPCPASAAGCTCKDDFVRDKSSRMCIKVQDCTNSGKC